MGLLDNLKDATKSVGLIGGTPKANANGIYNNRELEALINGALADGDISEQERHVLYRKAQSLGVNRDEFEIILNSRLHKTQQLNPTKTAPTVQQSNKVGTIKKCPACGAVVQSFTTKCVECGLEFNDVEVSRSIQRLFEMLYEVDHPRKSRSDMIFDTFFGPTINKDEQKKQIIQNFPIPNTKGDILEFLSLAVPLAKKKGNLLTANNEANAPHNKMVPTWKAKCEQIIMKAKFSMKDDRNTLSEIMEYAQQLGI